jgi:plasmid stabilization system protein ParE
MARVVWTRRAINQFHAILAYTADQFSAAAAEKLAERMNRAVKQVSDTPELGSIVPEFQRDNLREWRVKPFRLIYVIESEFVGIVSLVHHGRDLPSVVDPDTFGI